MDGERFDSLAKTLAAGADRRRLLRGAAAAGLAVLAARLGPSAGADAEERRRNRRHKERRGRRGRVGAAATTCGLVGAACAGDGDCCSGAVCRGNPKRCRCRYGRAECGGKCWVLATSERHCGACGNRCDVGWLCCGSRCVDPATNPDHCGACDQRCDAGACGRAACRGGVCRREEGCDDGLHCTQDHCDQTDGQCVSTPDDALCGFLAQDGQCLVGGCDPTHPDADPELGCVFTSPSGAPCGDDGGACQYGRCATPPRGCIGPGEACWPFADSRVACCAGEDACRPDPASDTGYACPCAPAGGGCRGDADCCGGRCSASFVCCADGEPCARAQEEPYVCPREQLCRSTPLRNYDVECCLPGERCADVGDGQRGCRA